MLATLGDLFFFVFQMLVEATVWLSDLVTRPVRFLFSRHYRAAVRQNWRLHPVRGWFEFVGGSVVLILFVAIVSVWALLFAATAKEPTPGDQKEIKNLKEKMIETFRRHRNERPKASNATMGRTATRRVSTLSVTGPFSFQATVVLDGYRIAHLL